MDRYHLAWLMVGKPKGIVRGRPMTADEEAAYVREVAEQKTAALRMSLDAVERQGMPFVGESGGVGRPASGASGTPTRRRRPTPGRPVAPIERRTAPGCRPTRAWPSAWPRRAARPTPISTTTRRAPRAPTRCSGDRTRPGRRRHADGPGPGPDRPRLHPARPAARPAHPGPRRRLLRAGRPQGPGRHGAAPPAGPPARRRGRRCATGSPAEVAEPDRRAWLDVQLVALETQAAVLAGDDAAVPRATSTRCFDLRAGAPSRRRVRGGRRADRRAPPRRRAAGGPARRLGRAVRRSRSIGCRRSSTGWSTAFRARAAATVRPARRARTCGSASSAGQPWGGLQLVRRRAPLADRHQHGPAGPGPDLVHDRRPRDVPGPPPRARLEGGRPRRRATAALEASILLINTPECLISEGLAELGVRFAVAARRRSADLLVELYERAGLPIAADPAAAREAAERTVAIAAPRRTLDRDRRATPRILRHADGRSHDEVLAYLRDVGRYAPAVGREAPRVHRASAVADVRLRLRRGRGAPRSLARRGPARRIGRPASGACSTSS